MATVDNEQGLIAQAVAGDRAALENLLQRQYAELSRYVAATLSAALKRQVDVDDILQETFVIAFKDIGRFEPRGARSFFAWLKTIADHRIQDAGRLHARQKRGGDRRQVAAAHGDRDSSLLWLSELLSDGAKSPSSHVARREAIEAMQIAIAALPDEHRQAVRLNLLKGQTIDEVAAALDRSAGSVRGLIHRAKARLRAALGRSSKWLKSS